MSHPPHQAFHDRAQEAIDNPILRNALREAQGKFREAKETAGNELGNLEEWRTRASAIRSHTIEYLDYYLDQFSAKVMENGGKVFFADTDTEAAQYILDIAQEKKANTVIKSKSMVSEELHLNQRLEEIGVEAIESDLGEFIIQLAKETPSHIIMPAIHKNKKQIAELLSQVAGEELPEDVKVLTQFARKQLREKFLHADIGVTGCNFAVAESGTMVLVSNEGNARLTTTLPKTHVVMMGMERIVPSWENLDSVLSLLPRVAAGQKITSYVTAINGSKKEEDIDGPEEFHVVIVDNGRSNALGTEYQEILNCIRCGACLNVCPVYRHIGGHAYGGVYPGPIGAVLTPILDGFDGWEELPFASSLCGACTEACPVKIPLHDMLVDLRADEVEGKRGSFMERLAFRGFGTAMKNPILYQLGIKMSKHLLSPYMDEDGYIKKASGLLKNWTESRDLPSPAKESFREWWKREEAGRGKEAGQEASKKGGQDNGH